MWCGGLEIELLLFIKESADVILASNPDISWFHLFGGVFRHIWEELLVQTSDLSSDIHDSASNKLQNMDKHLLVLKENLVALRFFMLLLQSTPREAL